MYRGYDKKWGLYKYISSICKPKNWNQFKGLIWVNKHFGTSEENHPLIINKAIYLNE